MLDKKEEIKSKKPKNEQFALKINNYILNAKPIGSGSYGTVFLAKNEKNEYFAAKRIDREYISDIYYKEKLKAELKLYHKLKNKHIIGLKDIKFTTNHLFIFLEYCDCETLTSFLKNYLKIFHHLPSSSLIQNFSKQMVDGLSYMARNNCVHRDLKLDNIMLSQNITNTKEYHGNIGNLINYSVEASCSIPIGETIYPKNCFENLSSCPLYYDKQYTTNEIQFEKLLKERYVIKLIDLGLGRKMDSNGNANTVCGTPVHMAPEIYAVNFGEGKNYSSKVDLWSLGCVLFHFAFGVIPFYEEEEEKIYNKIKNGEYKIPKTSNLTYELLDLISGLLRINAEDRYDWDTVLCHPFFSKNDNELTLYNWGNDQELILNSNNKVNFIKKFEVVKTMHKKPEEQEIIMRKEVLNSKFSMFDIFNANNCCVLEFVSSLADVDDDWTLISVKTHLDNDNENDKEKEKEKNK